MMDIQGAAPAPPGEQLVSFSSNLFRQQHLQIFCPQHCPQRTSLACSRFVSACSDNIRPVLNLITFSTTFFFSAPSMYPDQSLAFVDGTMAIILSRAWHETLSTSLFKLHRQAFCGGDACDKEAAFRVQMAYAIILLIPACMLKYNSSTSTNEASRSLRSILSTAPSYLVGWALGDALVQLQTEWGESWSLCTTLLTDDGNATSAYDCSLFNAVYALLMSVLGGVFLCRVQPLVLELAEGDGALATLEVFCQLTFVAVSVALLVVWHSTLSSMALVGTQLTSVPVINLHLLLLLAAAVTGAVPLLVRYLQNMIEDLQLPMESAEKSGRLQNEARIRAAEVAEKARIAWEEEEATARAEELAARKRAIAAAEARLEEARQQKEGVDKDLAALSSRRLDIANTEKYGVSVDEDEHGLDDDTNLAEEKHESIFTGWLKSIPALSPERYVDQGGDGLDDSTRLVQFRFEEMPFKFWKPDPDGTGFIRMATPRGDGLATNSDVLAGTDIATQEVFSTSQGEAVVCNEASLPQPVPLPVLAAHTQTSQDRSTGPQYVSPVHEMAYQGWLARTPAPPPTTSRSPPPSPPESVSAGLGVELSSGSRRIRTPQELFLASLLEMYSHSRIILGWLVAWTWIDVAGVFLPFANAPSLGVAAVNSLSAITMATAGYVGFFFAEASWTVTIDAVPFLVGYTATFFLRDLNTLFAGMVASTLSLLPESSRFDAFDSSTSSAIVFVLLISLGVFELKYMFARTQARGQTSVEPLLAETAGEDSALYNA